MFSQITNWNIAVKPGFTLIESLVYLAVGAALSLMISTLCITLVRQKAHAVRSRDNHLALWIALDRMTTDIKMASSGRSAWKKITPDSIIWHDHRGYDCGWSITKGKLRRHEGRFAMGSWHKHTVNTIALLDEALFALEYSPNGTVQGVWCTVRRAEHTLKRFVYCFSGRAYDLG